MIFREKNKLKINPILTFTYFTCSFTGIVRVAHLQVRIAHIMQSNIKGALSQYMSNEGKHKQKNAAMHKHAVVLDAFIFYPMGRPREWLLSKVPHTRFSLSLYVS